MIVATYKEMVGHCNCQTHDSPSIGCRDPNRYETEEEFYDGKDLLSRLREIWPDWDCPIEYIWDRKVPVNKVEVEFLVRVERVGDVDLVFNMNQSTEDVKKRTSEQIAALIDNKITDLRIVGKETENMNIQSLLEKPLTGKDMIILLLVYQFVVKNPNLLSDLISRPIASVIDEVLKKVKDGA